MSFFITTIYPRTLNIAHLTFSYCARQFRPRNMLTEVNLHTPKGLCVLFVMVFLFLFLSSSVWFKQFFMCNCFCHSEVPEHLFELFDLVVRKFLGTAVVEEGSGVGERTSIDLEKHGGRRSSIPLKEFRKSHMIYNLLSSSSSTASSFVPER